MENNKISTKFEKEIALLSSCINKAKRKNFKQKNKEKINPLLISNYSLFDKTDILKNKEHQNHFNNQTFKKINKVTTKTNQNNDSYNYDFLSNKPKNSNYKTSNKYFNNYEYNKNKSVKNCHENNCNIYMKPKLVIGDYLKKIKNNENLLTMKSILTQNNYINNIPKHKKIINNIKEIYNYSQKDKCRNNDPNNKTANNSFNLNLLSEKYLNKRAFSTEHFEKNYSINLYDYNAINNKTSIYKDVGNLGQESKVCLKKCQSHYLTNNFINNTTNDRIHNNLIKNDIFNKNSNSNFRTQNNIKKKKHTPKNINNALNQRYFNIFTSPNTNNNNKNKDKSDINQKNNSIDKKYKELLNLLEVSNVDDGINKLKNLLMYKKFIVELKNLCIKYGKNNNKTNGNDILNLNDIYLWISSSLENSRKDSCYKDILVDLMNKCNINNLDELQKFINTRICVKKKNDNFVYKIKNILCESNTLINGNNIYRCNKSGKNYSSANISRIHGNALSNIEDSFNNSEDIDINELNLENIRK